MAQTFSTVIFDLDGVIVDTAEFHYRAWKRLADELGVPFDRDKNHRLRGVDRMCSLEIILEDVEPRPGNLRELADRKNACYVEMIQALTPDDLLPGVQGLFQTLREQEIAVGLASASKNARPVLKLLEIEPLLDAVVDGNDFTRGKPAPDIFLLAAERLGRTPDECVVVEDAQVGVDAARAAGMYAVGVCEGRALEGADVLIGRAADLPMELFGG